MNTSYWDPLEGQLPDEYVIATKKREISNILKSYTGWYDPFAEMIQNALDAVERRFSSSDGYDPKIFVLIDLSMKSISVTDNGIGFNSNHFKYFLAPMVSFKTGGERGEKGVGATYLAYGFNFLQIGTKTDDFSFVGTIKDGRMWVDDDENVVPRPVVSPSEPVHEAFNAVDRGSTFTLRLIGDGVRPSDLDWNGATTAKQWAAILLLKTPLGGVYHDATVPPTKCEITVIDKKKT